MSIVPKETIEVIAQGIGISCLSPDVLPDLSADVEYRLREIMQEAIKCMRHSKRTTLTTYDVDIALGLRNVEPTYGFASGDPLRFKRAVGHKDLFYIEEKDVEFKEVIEAPLPKAPLDTALVAHWLAIEGVQPDIPENPPSEVLRMLSMPAGSRKAEVKEDGIPVDIKLPIKHVLSRELQLYFEDVTKFTVSKIESDKFQEILMSLGTDSGIHPLVPHFTHFVAVEVPRNLNNLPVLFELMRFVWSLLWNPHIHVERYLYQLMPSVMTCLVSKRLGNKLSDNHWDLRNYTACLVASICERFDHVDHNLKSSVIRPLQDALNPTKGLPQRYGAVQGLAALGPNEVQSVILRNLKRCLQPLEPEMQLEKQKNETKRHEAWILYEALMRAVGLWLYNWMKMLPPLPYAAARSVCKSNSKVVTASSNKRKASTNNMMQQPPLKKLATESSDSQPGTSTNIGASRNKYVGGSSSRSSRRKIVGGQELKWKEDMDEYFGESMSSFVPSPYTSLFL